MALGDFLNSFFGFFNFLLPLLCGITFQLLPFCPLCPCFRLSELRNISGTDTVCIISSENSLAGGAEAIVINDGNDNWGAITDATSGEKSCRSPDNGEGPDTLVTDHEFDSCINILDIAIRDNFLWNICFPN